MVVLDAARDPEAGSGSEIAPFEDDALREGDTGMDLGARDRILDRPAFDLDVGAALQARVDAIEGEFIRTVERPVHFWPRPAKDSPRSSNLTTEQFLNSGTLPRVRALIDEDEGFAVALMDGTGPIGKDGEVQAIER